MSQIPNLEALGHAPWRPGSDPAHIIGTWAEDGSNYDVTVPSQLRDQIIELQNTLHRRLDRLKDLRQEVESEQRALENFLS